MQDRIVDFYCKKCKKSLKAGHLLTGCNDTPVLPNTFMKCHHCKRVIILKKWTEGMLIERSEGGIARI